MVPPDVLGAERNLGLLRYLPRQDYVNGRIEAYQVFASRDGVDWQEVSTGEFQDSTDMQNAVLHPR